MAMMSAPLLMTMPGGCAISKIHYPDEFNYIKFRILQRRRAEDIKGSDVVLPDALAQSGLRCNAGYRYLGHAAAELQPNTPQSNALMAWK